MWSQVEKDLEGLLVAKIYPVLKTDPIYRQFLSFAGVGPNFPASVAAIPEPARSNFAKVAKMRAHLAVAEIAKSGGLVESQSCAKLIQAHTVLYRFWDSKAPDRRTGIWWFDASVIVVCKREAGRTAKERHAWLREHLAVCLDWSKMDRIDILTLTGADELPVVEGTGSPMGLYSRSGLLRGDVEPKVYYTALGKFFPGGMKQTVLPFIPTSQGQDLTSFLSRA